ncbi:MAG: hypothetical protein DMF86_21510 [Acidobacteria bacterium]|nr:MAG: hypothetical protein DMF86_21510 [Acidobacteriota bacterium]
MFSKELYRQGHTQRFTIQAKGTDGWEVREERDSQVLRRVCYTDWHRVERALFAFTLRVSELESRGWEEARAGC